MLSEWLNTSKHTFEREPGIVPIMPGESQTYTQVWLSFASAALACAAAESVLCTIPPWHAKIPLPSEWIIIFEEKPLKISREFEPPATLPGKMQFQPEQSFVPAFEKIDEPNFEKIVEQPSTSGSSPSHPEPTQPVQPALQSYRQELVGRAWGSSVNPPPPAKSASFSNGGDLSKHRTNVEDVKCTVCNQKGHLKFSCPNKTNPNQVQCFKCKQYGHGFGDWYVSFSKKG